MSAVLRSSAVHATSPVRRAPAAARDCLGACAPRVVPAIQVTSTTMMQMRCFRIAGALVALASVDTVSGAFAQEPRLNRRTTTQHWSMEIVRDDLSYPWNLNRVGDQIIITEAAGN